jgi:uncharacterized protein (DUF885 family)
MHRREFVHRSVWAVAAFGILRQVGACRPGTPSTGPTTAGSPFAALRDRYFLRTLELNPVVSTYLGGDGYSPTLADINGRLRDYRPAALEREAAFYHEIADGLAKVDRAALDPADRIDADVLEAQLAFLLHQLEDRRYHERSVDTYVAEPFRGVDWQLQQMQSFPGGELGTEAEWQLVIARLQAVPAYVDSALANLREGKRRGNQPDRRMVQRDGLDGSAANAVYFRTTLRDTAARLLGARPFAAATLAQVASVAAGAADAYERFGRGLGELFDVHETVDRFAAGEAEYDWRLRHCLNVSRRSSELYQYGADQVALYEGKVFEVAAEVARAAGLTLPFGTDQERRASVRAVLDLLSKDAPADDDELFRWYREDGERAVAYGREHNLFDIPPTYRLDVVPTPPVLRSTIDAAYYAAPPFKRSGVGRFYLTPTGNDPAALKLKNRSSVADTAVHEGFPGHDWHYKYMTEHAREISNIRWLTPGAVEDSSSMWEDSMAAEGWALYSEELMAEPVPGRPHGFYTAAEHLYELQGQLLRAVRVRVDVGIHTGRMSFDEAVDYFTAHVFFHPGACAEASTDATARAICEQARRALYRYSKWPTQAITYNLGKNEILALREAVRAREGERFSAKAFHERLMRMGTIPAGYFRSTFLG